MLSLRSMLRSRCSRFLKMIGWQGKATGYCPRASAPRFGVAIAVMRFSSLRLCFQVSLQAALWT
jgi:hypothetical protein